MAPCQTCNRERKYKIYCLPFVGAWPRRKHICDNILETKMCMLINIVPSDVPLKSQGSKYTVVGDFSTRKTVDLCWSVVFFRISLIRSDLIAASSFIAFRVFVLPRRSVNHLRVYWNKEKKNKCCTMDWFIQFITFLSIYECKLKVLSFWHFHYCSSYYKFLFFTFSCKVF